MTCAKKTSWIVCVVIAFLLSQGLPVTQGQPSISSVTGTISNGSLMTISGTALNSEAKLNWDTFFNSNPNAWSFEGSSPSSDGYGAIGPSGGTYDTNVKILGNRSIRFHTQGAGGNCPTGNLADYNAINPSSGNNTDLWVRVYVRWSLNGGGWPSSHIKMVDSQGPGGVLQFYFNPSNDINGILPRTFQATYNANSTNVSIPSGQLQNNRWYTIEMHWKTTSPQVYAAWVDGTQVINATPSGTSGLDYILFGLINLCGTNSSFNLDHWMDGFAVATSRIYPSAIVEVGNSPTYATAAKNVQPLETISDNQIKFKLDLTNLGSGPYYAWVRNNTQTISSAILLGGSSATPTTPVNLRIVR